MCDDRQQVEYFRPTNVIEAVDWLATNDAQIAAGCTDLFPATEAPSLGGNLLDVTAIEGLHGITETDDHWRLGATTTWTDIIRADLPGAFDGLKQAAREIGSVQIQNSATIGGNLCNASPAADGAPCLLTLGARVELTSKAGTRVFPLNEFSLGPRHTALGTDEILTAVLIPKPTNGRSAFIKLGARKHLVISIVMVAVCLTENDGAIETASIAVGSCSAVATRLPELEAALIGQSMNGDMAELISDELVGAQLSPISDVRADAQYRKDAARELVQRAIRAAAS